MEQLQRTDDNKRSKDYEQIERSFYSKTTYTWSCLYTNGKQVERRSFSPDKSNWRFHLYTLYELWKHEEE